VRAWLLCDWGTTNVRAWRVEDGVARAMASFPLGVSRIGSGRVEARLDTDVRPALDAEGLPVLLGGMAGSNLGWTAAPYVDCPATLGSLEAAVVRPAPGVWISPGVRTRGANHGPDVMRGEELQVFGALARTTEPRLLCLPGTHAKWVRVEHGRIIDFVTVMTGELFAVLNTHSVLAAEGDPGDAAGFAAGLAAAGEGDNLSARLFGVRARRLTGDLPPGQEPAFLSGLLIGADVAAGPRLLGATTDMPVTLIGDTALCAAYRQALSGRGRASEILDGDAAALTGLMALAERIHP
jgi:2-dehydro-3-deoxygalactonokinase